MSDAVRLATWIRENADKRGTPDFEKVSLALKKLIAEENAVSADATADMSPGQLFAAGAGKAVADIGRGAGQMLGLVDDAEVREARERDRALMATGSGVAGNIAGTIGAAAPASLVPGVNTYLGAAATGGAYGALNPTEGGPGKRAKNVMFGAGLGAGAKGALQGLGFLLRRGKSAVGPFLPGGARRAAGAALDDAAGGRRDAVIAALRSADDTFRPTAGQAATPAGSAEFSALQKIAEQTDPSKYASIADDQAARLLAPIRRIAGRRMSGGVDDLERAMRLRAENARWLYPSGRANITPELDDMMGKKLIASSVKKARAISDASGYADDSIDFLQVLKEQVDDQILEAPRNKAVRMRAFRDRLVKEIGDNNPEWSVARQVYAEDSLPINQMRVGRELERAMTPALNDFSEDAISMRPTVLANALRESPRTIKRAVGTSRYGAIDEILGAGDVADIDSVARNLANNSQFSRLARAGISEANASLESVKPGQLPGILERSVVIANSILGRTGKRSGERIVKYLAENMDNPQMIADIMERAAPTEKAAIQAVINVLSGSAPAASATLAE